jgi:hypothetical protein
MGSEHNFSFFKITNNSKARLEIRQSFLGLNVRSNAIFERKQR